MKILSILLALLWVTGCTTVKPWERGYLAKEQMLFDGDPRESAAQSQVYFSKEASSGGSGAAGGGCGCN